MIHKLLVGILSLSLVCVVVEANAAPGDKANQTVAQGPRRHLANIVFSGLAGAILGLSTLSFYGRPQDKLSNIAVGFAIGVISGTLYTTYKAAAEPRDFYAASLELEPEVWTLAADRTQQLQSQTATLPRLGFTFEF